MPYETAARSKRRRDAGVQGFFGLGRGEVRAYRRDQARPELLRQGVLKEIVAFLNTDGGELLIGVLETASFGWCAGCCVRPSPPKKGNVLFGLALEYGQGGWDAFQRRLQRAITEKIGGDVLERPLGRNQEGTV